MGARTVILFLFVYFCTLISFTTDASTTKRGFSNKIYPNISGANSAKLRCYLNEDEFRLSVVSVLKLDEKDESFRGSDIGVTTGHGLVGADGEFLSDCFVYGPSGRKYKVKAQKLAPGFKRAASSDWAVIVFDKIRDKNLVRYVVDPGLSLTEFESLADEKFAVNFSTARGIHKNGQACHLFPRKVASLKGDKFRGIVPHSCKSISGQSGSPVSISSASDSVLVGIHVGQSFALPIKNVTERARWYGFMRVVDNEFLYTLSGLLNDLELDD